MDMNIAATNTTLTLIFGLMEKRCTNTLPNKSNTTVVTLYHRPQCLDDEAPATPDKLSEAGRISKYPAVHVIVRLRHIQEKECLWAACLRHAAHRHSFSSRAAQR